MRRLYLLINGFAVFSGLGGGPVFAQICESSKGWCYVQPANADIVIAYLFEKRLGPLAHGRVNTFFPTKGWVGESKIAINCDKRVIKIGINNPWESIRTESTYQFISNDMCSR